MNRKKKRQRSLRRKTHARRSTGPADAGPTEYPRVDKGHIVSRMYLNGFADNEQVAVHVAGKDRCFLMSTKDAGTRRRFYSRTRPNGERIDDMEASLARGEATTAPVLRQVIDGASIDAEAKATLAQFVAVQMFRGPAFVRERESFMHQLVRDHIDEGAVLPDVLLAMDGDIEAVRSRMVDSHSSKANLFIDMASHAGKCASVLGHMQWQVLRFDLPIVACSDHPVVLWPEAIARYDSPPDRPSYGPLSAIEVRVPLSSRAVLLMSWADSPDACIASADTAFAAETNVLVAGQADVQWMHRPGIEPPLARRHLSPISSKLDPNYSVHAARRSLRRLVAVKYIERVSNAKFVEECEVLGPGLFA